ncbi:P-loop containing nucleoside triphosphate hydrolase protein [Cantharellus anzutake]|uniref:P-loop containing nucleoside triphosphate hydrolase protein n=1 Tax=Cantharellus anzutake TaxID=1750568 RepID=UPI001905FD2F|nr:P-loop containing nucleoside triphosphate hydrolase protein [Cantharellus anzutake]KAF8332683.1 P-loop containing nucleoside triphosphate hydrolase protein [Cantharellus anzutake]
MSAISVKNLTFNHGPSGPALFDLSLELPKGSRTLLIGANGAGKSTLLQVLAGKRMVPGGMRVTILGRDVFRNTPEGITILGTEWAMNPVVRSDIVVSTFLDSVGGYRHKERRDRLLDILDVDLDWHMHAISDGERRRVQLTMGLMAPWDVLLLDEVTVDLDVLVRDNLLSFLKEESEQRGATVLYATHIFDGLNTFPTHIAHIRDGRFATPPTPWPLRDGAVGAERSPAFEASVSLVESPANVGSVLYALALGWLKEDREIRRRAEASGERIKTRGARYEVSTALHEKDRATEALVHVQAVPTESEVFYKKYVVSHYTHCLGHLSGNRYDYSH